MENRLEQIQQQLRSLTNNVWCQTLANEIERLFSKLSARLPIYQTELTRDQLFNSMRTVEHLNLNVSNHEIYQRGLINYIHLVSIHTNKYLCEYFLRYLHRLKTDLNYWRNEDKDFHRQIPLIEQLKTTFWFEKNQDEIRLSEKIKYLTNQETFVVILIGRLAEQIDALENRPFDREILMKGTNFLSETLFERTTVNYNRQSDLLDVFEFYFQIFNGFDEFETNWNKKLEAYRRPGHLKRYFTTYVVVSAVGSYAFYRIYTNRTDIGQWLSASYDSLKFFVNEHLIVPLKTIYSSTFESRTSQTDFENSQLNYINSKKILQEMLEDYGRKHAQTLAALDQISVQSFLSTLNQRAINEDMNIVMRNYQQQLDVPIRSALMDDLIKGILIQVQKVKVDGEGLVIQIDQLMKQNQINFSLLATIPSVLLLTFVILTTKNLIANRILKRRSFDLTTLRHRIIVKLRLIEHLLIFNSEQTSLMFTEHQLVRCENENSTWNFGELLSLIYELKIFTDQLNSRRMLSKEMNEDIHLLSSPQLSAQQKLLLIEQIYHSYSYLVQWS